MNTYCDDCKRCTGGNMRKTDVPGGDDHNRCWECEATLQAGMAEADAMISDLRAERDALREALKMVMEIGYDCPRGYLARAHNAIRAAFPDIQITSRFRPGSVTVSGNLSYHARGRALDLSPRMDVFNWIAANYPDSAELIFTPAGGRQLKNGKRYVYAQNVAKGHWDHVHWAM